MGVCLLVAAALPIGLAPRFAVAAVGHLVISEVVTGGASASDELIELYNPSPEALPLEGLELVYVTATGATVTRRAAWSAGAASVPPGAHVLVANELGVYAAIGDARYASGMAATGGSVALRIQGAATAIDAVGWGTAAGTWLEGTPAPAPAAGASVERRPGGDAGSTVDTDDNASDFVVRAVPDPQNASSAVVPSASASPDPSTPSPIPSSTPDPGTPSPIPSATPDPTPTLTPEPASPTPAPTATVVSIATSRALSDGSPATIQATALTASDFTDGGGYLADDSGGIAVMLDGGIFARGDLVLVSGTVDDRFAQRTLRASSVTVVPGGAAPMSLARGTGAIDESVEGRLVTVAGAIDGGPTVLSGGVAFDVDDGSGAIRVVIGAVSGIDTQAWSDGRQIVVTGVVGQRDSSGTGAEGYRVQPRDGADVELLPALSPSPSPSVDQPPSPTPSATPASVSSIAEARAAAQNAKLTVRGVVTLASGTAEDGSAVIQDASGAILVRLGDEAGALQLGQLVELDAVRSTKSGMESLRVSKAPRQLGAAADPAARQVRSGEAGEPHEAQLVVARGALVESARRASSGSVSFELDDGSGPLRVVMGAALAADDEALERGAWVEVTGPLGQQTTGSQPLTGYRVWPRSPGEVRILAAATNGDDDDAGGRGDGRGEGHEGGPSSGGGSAASDSLAAIGAGPLGELRVGATLVTATWDEVGLAGLLWDGRLLVGIAPESAEILELAVGGRPLPVSVELGHLATTGTGPSLGVTVVMLGSGPGDVLVGDSPTAAPLSRLPERGSPAAWVSVVGRLAGDSLRVGGDRRIRVEELCDGGRSVSSGTVSVTGVALGEPSRIVVPCGGLKPAPRLELALVAARSNRSPSTEPTSTRIVAGGAATDGERRRLAAALLGAGIGVLLLASLVGWRLGRSAGAVERPAPEDEGEAGPDGPRLTLVSVPREHG